MINFDKMKKESKIMKKITYNLKEVFKENSTVIINIYQTKIYKN